MATGAQSTAPQISKGDAPSGPPVERWARTPISERTRVMRRFRDLLATHAHELADAIAPELARTKADTLAAEVLPLLEACKFLEREAEAILKPAHLGKRGLPFWLAGVDSTVERVPLGSVLIIAPANYPLFLPGVQALQALAAGNNVIWKPGHNGAPVARGFERLALEAGVPASAVRVTDDSIKSSIAEIKAGPQKIVFTGSNAAGRAVMQLAAEQAIPVIAELSGCDAVIALPTGDPDRLADALCFGMRLNGSATCMAPRRLILVGAETSSLVTKLQQRFAAMDPVFTGSDTRLRLAAMLADAESQGGVVCGELGSVSMKPILVLNGSAQMALAQTDLFAPVLTVISANNVDEALRIERECPFGLTCAIFGDVAEAKAIGARLQVGTVLINDLIVPTADPRIPFGGRRGSGFGVTRGREGLLEMTAVKTTLIRTSKDRKHLQPTTSAHEELFGGVIAMSHLSKASARLAGLKRIVAAAKRLKQRSP